MHNEESVYYKELARSESLFKNCIHNEQVAENTITIYPMPAPMPGL
jgi:hypothetical protein